MLGYLYFIFFACPHFCHLKAGNTLRAEKEFDDLLTRWENNPHLAKELWGVQLAEAAKGELSQGICECAVKLFKREESEFLIHDKEVF
ncbi:MAG: hypothetical protein GY749_04230 [Desulfobacteraceae bacterium]|nr:hypothetical protein [Desulfobacteraceae bacterium]